MRPARKIALALLLGVAVLAGAGDCDDMRVFCASKLVALAALALAVPMASDTYGPRRRGGKR